MWATDHGSYRDIIKDLNVRIRLSAFHPVRSSRSAFSHRINQCLFSRFRLPAHLRILLCIRYIRFPWSHLIPRIATAMVTWQFWVIYPCSAITVPLYLLILFIILRHRKSDYFRSTFFSLLLHQVPVFSLTIFVGG